ncbi:MAG TPA: caspase family protein [Thermoanaerobaculia bacterium]|nr:caspase family protein [Thermoanaerobaculia bacterium]
MIIRWLRFAAATLALVSSCFAARAEGSPTARRALLIGIEDYSGKGLRGTPSPVRRNWSNLYAAVDDAEAMQETLVSEFGFEARDVVLLRNQEATRAAILRAIVTHLTEPSRAGDIAVFYFAGHGSQVPNPLSTEDDKRDETIVPADSRVGAPDIRDKELKRLFNAIVDRGAKLTVILDNCNSASGTRGLLTGARVRALRPDPRVVADAGEAVAPEDRGALVIAAAQDYETARETLIDGTDRGVFSWALLRAIRAADDEEPAMETFLRAQAILRGETVDQQPVIAGTPEARQRPLFGGLGSGKRRDVFAVERVDKDGRVVLQGGWAHGLTVGSELALRGDRRTRLEVTLMLGLSRSEARIVSSSRAMQPGALFEIASWAAPPARPLHVWMPSTRMYEAAVREARELERLAVRRRIRWITDPTEETPSHVLRARGSTWELLTRDGSIERLGSLIARAALARIPTDASLFVQIPAPATLVKAIEIGPGTARETIQRIEKPEHADFVLTGRLAEGIVSFAWVRPLAAKGVASVLPERTAWKPAGGALALQYDVVRLRRIHAWHTLESPTSAAFAYRLSIRRSRDRTPVPNGVLTAGEAYSLVLRARPVPAVEQRFVYAFVIDRNGKSILLFPLHGSVENRFPLRKGNEPPAEIVLDGPFDVTEPYGPDTYFLLSTDEPLPDPWILEWDGVRSPPQATTPLEELLLRTIGLRRATQPTRIASRWSIERVLFESVPGSRAKEP